MHRLVPIVVLFFAAVSGGARVDVARSRARRAGLRLRPGSPVCGGSAPRHRNRHSGRQPCARARGRDVSFAGTVPGSGLSLTIRTADGLAVTLTTLGSLGVARGDAVAEGDAVATAGRRPGPSRCPRGSERAGLPRSVALPAAAQSAERPGADACACARPDGRACAGCRSRALRLPLLAPHRRLRLRDGRPRPPRPPHAETEPARGRRSSVRAGLHRGRRSISGRRQSRDPTERPAHRDARSRAPAAGGSAAVHAPPGSQVAAVQATAPSPARPPREPARPVQRAIRGCVIDGRPLHGRARHGRALHCRARHGRAPHEGASPERPPRPVVPTAIRVSAPAHDVRAASASQTAGRAAPEPVHRASLHAQPPSARPGPGRPFWQMLLGILSSIGAGIAAVVALVRIPLFRRGRLAT